MKGYADLGDLTEDDRINVLSRYIDAHPLELVGVAVNSKATAARYAEKIHKRVKIDVVDTVEMTLADGVKVVALKVRKQAH
jgi:hypothetical protein